MFMESPEAYQQRLERIFQALSQKKYTAAAEMLPDSVSESIVTWLDKFCLANGLKRNYIFQQVGIAASYGYKLFSGEKPFVNRNVLLRFCFAMHAGVANAQIALRLAGLRALHDDDRRDEVLMIGLNKNYRWQQVDEWLTGCQLEGLCDDSP